MSLPSPISATEAAADSMDINGEVRSLRTERISN